MRPLSHQRTTCDLEALSGVVSATVNVVCELARKSNPRNYLPLAPQLFEILTTSSNNWMLIKIVKLVCHPCRIPPRSGCTYQPSIRSVRYAHTHRATSCPEAPATVDQSHLDHACHLTVVRVREDVHRRRDAGFANGGWGCTRQGLCGEIERIPIGRGSES